MMRTAQTGHLVLLRGEARDERAMELSEATDDEQASLFQPGEKDGAGDENRTRLFSLGS